MGFFKRDSADSVHLSQRYQPPQQDLFLDESDTYSEAVEEENEDDHNIGIKFKKQLPSGALIFLIVDDDFDWIGSYVVVSPSGIVNIIDNDFEDYEGDLNSAICNRLKEKAKAFYDATIAYHN